jgi:predicted N-acetyltransferase YhbS
VASDVDEADRVMRSAFGTYLGMADPGGFGGDAEFVRTRAAAGHVSAFVAEREGRVVGSSMVTRWGSFAFVGPVTVDASAWNGGLGRRLMEPVVDELAVWGVTFAGLFTFANSAKHIGLYHRFGFYPRTLTALMGRRVDQHPAQGPAARTLSARAAPDQVQLLADIGELCSTVFDGLDLSGEIEALTSQGLGDVVLIEAAHGLEAFAVCHVGAGTEAGGGTCYVKFAAARPGPPLHGDLRCAARRL